MYYILSGNCFSVPDGVNKISVEKSLKEISDGKYKVELPAVGSYEVKCRVKDNDDLHDKTEDVIEVVTGGFRFIKNV